MRFLFQLILSILISVTAVAGDIKAIVNDTPISAFDVTARAKIKLLQQTGSVGEITKALEEEALEELIEERIKIQEALKQGIKITKEEIEDAILHLEQQNGLGKDGFKNLLQTSGIPYQTLFNQTEANLAWLRVLQMSGRVVHVNEAEVKLRKKVIKKELSEEAISFAEIVVPTEEKATEIWEKLQNGISFELLVNAESIADSRLSEGRVINVPLNYYGSAVQNVFKQMQPGQLSRPLKVKNGYAVILMLDKRAPITGDFITLWEMVQGVIPNEDEVNETLQADSFKGCDPFVDIIKKRSVPGSFQRGAVSPDQLPSDLAPLIKGIDFEKVAGPVPTPMGNLYLMKCREETQRVVPTDDELRAGLEGEQMERLSQQLISELKRDVVIEYK